MNLRAILLTLCLPILGYGQNQISAPAGQTLKITADTTVVNGNIRINAGNLFMGNDRFLSTSPLASKFNTFVGQNAGNLTMAGTSNSFLGAKAGLANSAGVNNTFIGFESGLAATASNSNTFVGNQSGLMTTGTSPVGSFNTFIGSSAGRRNTTGQSNTFIGYEAGYGSTTAAVTGTGNVFIGRAAGYSYSTGSNNTFIGMAAGNATTGAASGNVFLGYLAGFNEQGSNKLYISNSNTATPLIYGDFSTSRLIFYGQVGAATPNFPTLVDGTNTSNFKLFVKGGILTENLVVQTGWADYVFDKDYKLKSLKEVEEFIDDNGHLPGVPSAGQLALTGVDLGDMARIQQEKIEELTLYVIDHEKKISENQKRIDSQQKQIDQIKDLLKQNVKSSRSN